MPKTLEMTSYTARRARRWLASVTVIAMVLPLAPLAAEAQEVPAESTFTFFGGGWGHGTGMSQYGAQGQALAGKSWPEILTHYFTGVGIQELNFDDTPSTIEYEGPVWVGLEQNLTHQDIRIWGTSPDIDFVTVTRGEERQDVLEGNTISFDWTPEGCTFSVQEIAWPPGPCTFDIDWDGWTDTPTVVLDTTILDDSRSCDTAGERCYNRGSLLVRPNRRAETPATGFHLVTKVNLDHYLYGLAEVPYSWHPDTLRAQAVAGRSYAVNRQAVRGKPSSNALRQDLCWCQLYDSIVDQHYVGWGRGEAAWLDAVDDTQYLVLSHPEVVKPPGVAPSSNAEAGDPIAVPTFYSSSTFGHTEDSGVAFNSGATPSYLVGVPDPWSVDPAVGNPFATWSKEMTASQVASAVGMDSVTDVEIISVLRPGTEFEAAYQVRFTGTDEGAAAAKTFLASSLRSRLGLRSMQITSVEKFTPPDIIDSGGPPPPRPYDVGMHNPERGLWYLRDAGGGVSEFYYGIPDDLPVTCDWNGDGQSTVGLYRPISGFMYLRFSNTFGVADTDFFYGMREDMPVCGDWDGDGDQTIGIWRPSERKFYLRNSNTLGFADIELTLDAPGSVPIAGDWDGDTRDTVGLWDAATGRLSLTNSLDAAAVDVIFDYNTEPTDRIITGDWDGDGVDSVGVFRPADATLYLRDLLDTNPANYIIEFGVDSFTPVAGMWDTPG